MAGLCGAIARGIVGVILMGGLERGIVILAEGLELGILYGVILIGGWERWIIGVAAFECGIVDCIERGINVVLV